jgi:hypothetical protein
MDSPLYVRMAEDLLAGRRGPSPAHHGYPALVALASLVLPGRELPGRIISLIASLALVVIVWQLANRRTPAVRWLPATLVALHPLLAVYGGAIMTESAFLALALAGVALLDSGRARAGGALLGAAWWVRPEAALVAPLAVALAPLNRRARVLALLLAACVALPYSVVLRIEQGHWSLTPTSVLVRAPFADARAAEWRLADSTAFADTTGLGPRLARDGGAIVRGYPPRLWSQARGVLDAWGWGLLALSLAGIGASAAGRGPWLALLALPFAYPLLAAPPDLRFAQLVVPALALAAGGAVAAAFARGRAWQLGAQTLVVAGLALTWLGPAGTRALAFDDGPIPPMRGAGAWLAAHAAPDAVIMDRKSYVPFFAQRTHVQLPDEPLDGVLRYARERGAAYIVVEEYVVGALRPQLAPLLDTAWLARDPRVRLVFAARPAPGDGVAVLEVVR